jgi:Gpi18-like mannosyltransferase
VESRLALVFNLGYSLAADGIARVGKFESIEDRGTRLRISVPDRAVGPVVLAAFAAASFAAALALLPIVGPKDGDFALFLIPWMDKIHELGWLSISGEFSEYPPTYIYLLNLAALLPVGTVAAVKLINIPFVALCAWAMGKLAKNDVALAAGLVTPTMLVNAFGFGQADTIYTAFLLLFVLWADRPALAAIAFGLALSFKLQAVFLSPLLLHLLLTKRMRWEALLIPATWAVMMLPANLASRPWSELLSVYVGQVGLVHDLSLNAPNPWWLLRSMDYQTGVIVGCGLGAVVGLWIALRKRDPLVIACLCALLLPFVLPKMTARYFFPADLLLIALAFRDPRYWPVAALCQMGSLLACMSYFVTWGTALFALIPMALSVILLLADDRSQRQSQPD